MDRSDADELANEVSLEPVEDVPGARVDTCTGELVDDLVGTDRLQASAARDAEPAF